MSEPEVSERDVLAIALFDYDWANDHRPVEPWAALSSTEQQFYRDQVTVRLLAALNAAGYTVARIQDDELGAAWAAAEAALPEGWHFFSVSLPRPEDGKYWASAHGPTVTGRCNMDREHDEYPRENGYGPTPAAALRALAKSLTS